VQWHNPTLTGCPLASIRVAPQLQVAVRVLVVCVLLGGPLVEVEIRSCTVAFRNVPMFETESVSANEPTEDLVTAHGTMVLAVLIWLLWVTFLVLGHTYPDLLAF
jgi:hypothetical protein